MLSMSNEVKLVLTLAVNGEEIPANLKEAAVEELRILAMHFGEGTAELYLIEMIIEAVENEDAEALVKAGDLVGKVMGANVLPVDDSVKELSHIAFEACEKFIDDVDTEEDGKVRQSIIAKLSKEGIFPMFYHDGFMVIYHVEYGIIILASVNGRHSDMHVMKNLFETMPDRNELLDKIRKLTGESAFEIRFGKLEYELLEDGYVSAILEEM